MEAVLYTHIRASPTPLFFGSQALNQSQFKLTHPLLQSTEPLPKKAASDRSLIASHERTNDKEEALSTRREHVTHSFPKLPPLNR